MGIPNFAEWRERCDEMRREKLAAFPNGSLVSVNSDRFHGVGIVTHDEGCPIDSLAVRVENENIWWYPIGDCQPYHGNMPSWTRRYFRRHGMRKIQATASASALAE